MNFVRFFFAVLLISLMGCSSMKTSRPKAQDPVDSPETVMITYYVKAQMEMVMQDVLSRAWVIYRKEHLVFAEPHTVVAVQDGGGRIRMVEVFTWVSHATPEHAPESVKEMWAQMQGLCQPRDGHAGIEGGAVQLLAPSNR